MYSWFQFLAQQTCMYLFFVHSQSCTSRTQTANQRARTQLPSAHAAHAPSGPRPPASVTWRSCRTPAHLVPAGFHRPDSLFRLPAACGVVVRWPRLDGPLRFQNPTSKLVSQPKRSVEFVATKGGFVEICKDFIKRSEPLQGRIWPSGGRG